MKIYKLLGAFTLLGMLVSGCGGDNTKNPESGGVPSDTSLDFELFPANYFSNYDASTSLSGSDNKGNTYVGSISEKTLPATMFLGKNALPIQSEISFTASNGGFASITQSQYFDANLNDIRLLGVDGNVGTVSATTNTIPPTAKIGDSGTAGTYTDNGGSVSTSTWRLEDGFNGNAKLIFSTMTHNPLGNLDNTFTTTRVIKPDGTRLSVELKTYNVNVDLEVILSGRY